MTDPLRGELERRSKSVNLNHDWARRELLPDVVAAIETRPQRVTASRGPALAGLAGVAAIILVLVVAIPRLAPIPPAQSPVVPPPATGTSISSRVQLQIMSAQEFAVGVLTGRLLSSTVLVDGTIGERSFGDGPFSRLCMPPDQPCLMGRLEGTDPSVDVQSRWRAAEEDDRMVVGGSDGTGWPWWHLPSGQITGTLVLSVGADGTIEFVGRIDPGGGATPLTVAEAVTLDVEAPDLDEVVLVEGWLWSGEAPPDGCCEASIVCLSPEPSPIPGLPNYHCQPQPRDAIVNYLVNTADSVTAPEPRLDVQRGAAETFGGSVGVNPHAFAVSPRLHGGGCTGAQPCWQWEVVARVTEVDSEPEASEFRCTSDEVDAIGGNRWPTLVDTTGLVESCSMVIPGTGGLLDTPVVVNPNGDEKVIRISWTGGVCDDELSFEFWNSPVGYQLTARWHGVDCEAMAIPRTMDLNLAAPVPAHLVHASVPYASPVSPPIPSPSPTTQTVECWRYVDWVPQPEPTGPVISILDEAGLVDRCTSFISGSSAEALEGPPVIATTTTPRASDFLILSWLGTTCDAAVEFAFRSVGDEFMLTAQPPAVECEQGPARYGLMLHLTRPLRGDQIAISVSGIPAQLPPPPTNAPPREFSCSEADQHATVIDETGMLTSCETVEATEEGGPIRVANRVDGDPSVLRVLWWGNPCHAAATFNLRPDGWSVSLAGEVYDVPCDEPRVGHEIRLHLNTDVVAANVDATLVLVSP